ncbi:hypothetical protein A2774_01840 [Candidatus Roizmanbacteria bacterium RIFCSPHIGHO2_01_FULL_39_12c]|uniref:Type 4 fimbrial biogenesis protein PilX N-terminal domain-containing protein n=1 Tax=Candidatus Roizmanbacteria bacterium RIFCSPHIGHO2_01_FULL_39_12c TaxID=1802031 RepID=A0A1F7GAZ6_9BACT|nr:MAG: hypothetical protein A2774_01840 [Candidatus Roizmanbacteria bacterium RIFCSPHIGHO2_01_FULL_39_12c]OGK46934.1 MAG: hypothetical protein A2963_05250 [Candidatus Roizmanbacteria bacterium RIFCSPLOWO2_01_FULL_40_13]
MKRGQTLIMLLVFMIIAITVTTAATALILVNSASAQKMEGGIIAYSVAESGIENGLLRLLRNPFYTGETLNLDEGTATITVTGSNPYTITSTGQSGSFTRVLQVVVNYNGNMTIASWNET